MISHAMPSLLPSEAAALRRAFSGDRRTDAHDTTRVEAVDGRVVAHRGDDVREVARESAAGVPDRPSISDDGTRVAFIRRSPKGRQSVEIITTAPDDWKAPVSTQELSASQPITAVDFAPGGQEIAFVTRDGELHVSPTLGSRGGRNHYERLTDTLGRPVGAQDVEFLPGGRVAVETTLGTYLLLDIGTPPTPLPMAAFDPEGWEARSRDAEMRLGALDGDERARTLQEFGTAALAVHPSPDGRAYVLQVRQDGDEVDNLVVERRTGRRASIGRSALETPSWSPDGREVWIKDGPSGTLSSLFNQWDADLGQEDLARREASSPGIITGDEAVWVGGVRVPRRARTRP